MLVINLCIRVSPLNKQTSEEILLHLFFLLDVLLLGIDFSIPLQHKGCSNFTLVGENIALISSRDTTMNYPNQCSVEEWG